MRRSVDLETMITLSRARLKGLPQERPQPMALENDLGDGWTSTTTSIHFGQPSLAKRPSEAQCSPTALRSGSRSGMPLLT